MSAFRISLLNFMYSCLFFFFIVVTFQDRLAVECLVPGGTGVCTKILSNIDVYPSLRVQAQKVQFTKPCGWNTCNAYKIVFVPVYYTESRAVYREELVCCPGYESIDNNNSCKELLILGGTEPPRRPGRPGHQGPGQPNGPPSNPNGPSWPGNPNVPRGPGLPGGRGNEGNPFGPNPDSPNSPGSNSNPSFGADNVPIVPIQPQNPLDPASPNAPNTPVRPGSPSNPGPTSSGPIGPGGPGASGNPVGPGSPNVQPNPSSPNFPGDSFSPNGPVIPDTIPGSQTERHGPFNPQPPLNPQQPFDPYDPVYPRDDSMNRGGSNSRTNTKFGQDGKIPDSHGNNNRKDTKYDDDGTEKEENYAPSDSKGSVLVIFGVMMLVMALFGLGAFGMAYMRKRVNMHEELEEETPRTSYSFSRWSRYWTGKFRIESFYLH